MEIIGANNAKMYLQIFLSRRISFCSNAIQFDSLSHEHLNQCSDLNLWYLSPIRNWLLNCRNLWKIEETHDFQNSLIIRGIQHIPHIQLRYSVFTEYEYERDKLEAATLDGAAHRVATRHYLIFRGDWAHLIATWRSRFQGQWWHKNHIIYWCRTPSLPAVGLWLNAVRQLF